VSHSRFPGASKRIVALIDRAPRDSDRESVVVLRSDVVKAIQGESTVTPTKYEYGNAVQQAREHYAALGWNLESTRAYAMGDGDVTPHGPLQEAVCDSIGSRDYTTLADLILDVSGVNLEYIDAETAEEAEAIEAAVLDAEHNTKALHRKLWVEICQLRKSKRAPIETVDRVRYRPIDGLRPSTCHEVPRPQIAGLNPSRAVPEPYRRVLREEEDARDAAMRQQRAAREGAALPPPYGDSLTLRRST